MAVALTFVMSIATAIGNSASTYLLLGAKMREEAEKATVERRAKGLSSPAKNSRPAQRLRQKLISAPTEGIPTPFVSAILF